MNQRARGRWSWALLALGGVLFFLGGIAGWINASVVNGDNFAAHANAIRSDAAVKTEIGKIVGGAAVDANPDLIAIRPAIESAVAAVVGSAVFDSSFTAAVKSFHSALTQPNSTSAVLTVADLGATVTTALEKFVPQAAQVIPADLNLKLAEVGGQSGIAAQIIPLTQSIRTLAWLLPLLAILALAGGVWAAPGRRVALVRAGWALVISGVALGVLVLVLGVAAALTNTATLTGALISATLAQLVEPLLSRTIVTVVMGGLLVLAAGAFLPQIELHQHVRRASGLVSWRPDRPSLQVVRALVIILVGVGMVAYPTFTAQFLAVCAGLVVFFWGVAELDRVAEQYLAADRESTQIRLASAAVGATPPRRRFHAAWLIPVGAAGLALLIGVLLLLPQALPQAQTQSVAASGDPDACNGYVELCDKTLDQVAFASSHNSMSAADEPGWFLAEQPTGMVKSLDDGIRGLLVDTWYGQATESGSAITADKSVAAAEQELADTYGPEVVASVRRTIDRVRREKGVGPVEPYFCHTVCEIGATAMLPVMKGIKSWLDAHPREVLIFFIQDTVSPADTAEVFDKAGLTDMAYVHEAGQPWPTLRQMIDSNKRMVVLMENTGGGEQYPWLMQGFDVVQDTPYTFHTVEDFSCDLERGTPDSPLFGINHWLASFTKLVTNAEKVNAYDVLSTRVKQCQAERDKMPNIIAVNWYDKGDLIRVVNEVNGVG